MRPSLEDALIEEIKRHKNNSKSDVLLRVMNRDELEKYLEDLNLGRV